MLTLNENCYILTVTDDGVRTIAQHLDNLRGISMARPRKRSAQSKFMSLTEAAEMLGVGRATARRLATESGSWLIFGERCKRIDIEKIFEYARQTYGQES